MTIIASIIESNLKPYGFKNKNLQVDTIPFHMCFNITLVLDSFTDSKSSVHIKYIFSYQVVPFLFYACLKPSSEIYWIKIYCPLYPIPLDFYRDYSKMDSFHIQNSKKQFQLYYSVRNTP